MLKVTGNFILRKMEKRGDERVLSVYWFLMFVIISIGVASAVISFYGKPLDIRGKEAGILADKVIECFVDKGVVKSDALKEINEQNLESRCSLYLQDRSSEAYLGKSQYFIRITIERAGDEGKNYEIAYGDRDFEPFCEQKESKINIPECIKKRFYALNEKGDFALVEITSAVRKIEQNAIS